jgi:cardiolipin synthase
MIEFSVNLRRHWFLLGASLAGLLAGCQTPAAHVAACNPAVPTPPRLVVLGRQLVQDTAFETAYHPLRSGLTMLSEPGVYLRAMAEGLTRKRIGLALAATPDPVQEVRPTLDPADLEAELRNLSGEPLRPADVDLFVDGGQALAALHGVIDQATCRIDVLMYLWDNDPVGEEIAGWLAAKAGPHCPVRVLVDGGGNLLQGLPKKASAAEVNRVVCQLAEQPYVEVIRTRDAWLRFDHRKLVVADGRVAWSGGRNFTAPSFFEAHDLSFTLVGPLAGELETRFERYWHEQGGKAAPPLDRTPALEENALARVVATRPRDRQLAETLYRAVDRACHHVYIENPYFVDSRLLYRLAEARQRGADVRVILTVQGDSKIINHANRVTVNRLLGAGVRVYLYPGMTHVKATVVDGCWAYLGTGNFDPLSLRHNRELGLAVGAGPLVAELEEVLFLPDLRPEWEQKKPLRVSPEDYAYEAVASLFL